MSIIDADALLEELRKSCKWHAENSRELSLLQRDINIVKEQPTVDAEPVRHGKWIDEGYYADNTNIKAWHCSECNWHMLGYEDELFRYCPICGARMVEDDQTD